MTATRSHILTIAVGERFRYQQDGPEFERVAGVGGRFRARRLDGRSPEATCDIEGAYVYPSKPDRGDDAFEEWEGLR